MHYVSVEGLEKSYGIQPLFAQLCFHIEEGDKIALVARNGSGKTTLLKILAGQEPPDAGKVWIHKDVTVALFEQDPAFLEDQSILDNIFHHHNPSLEAIKKYEEACDSHDEQALAKAILQMDALQAWDFDAKVKQILGKLNISQLHQTAGTLSGGQRKRVALARTLIDIGFEHKHVLLIMDEPTNHLDISMVEWLENYLNHERVTLLLVTHDRYFLDTVCNEIWELDREKLYIYKGDYENYLEKKALREENEAASIQKARNTYRKELEWMRKQPRARTTKAKSRIDAFYHVQEKARQRTEEDQLQLQLKMNRLGGKVVELKKVYKSYPGKVILKGFDYTFKKGERVGVIGKNGTGKSTFIELIQQLQPADSGKVNIGDTVIFGNYSQQGLQLKDDQRVIEFVKNIAENFPLSDGGSLSAAQFLQLFLFEPDKQYTYISKLSGGEKRRLHLLSILFKNPNFLILDEPTNDLDLPTLGVLEQFLDDFKGCLLIVSHDRYFMDRLVDHLLVFEGEGEIRDFPGNYSQYREWEKNRAEEKIEQPEPATFTKESKADKPPAEKKRFSYKEKREFELLGKEIPQLEKARIAIEAELTESELPFDRLQLLTQQLVDINASLEQKELRWLELSEYTD